MRVGGGAPFGSQWRPQSFSLVPALAPGIAHELPVEAAAAAPPIKNASISAWVRFVEVELPASDHGKHPFAQLGRYSGIATSYMFPCTLLVAAKRVAAVKRDEENRISTITLTFTTRGGSGVEVKMKYYDRMKLNS